jgi:hypothetical protein
MKKVSKRIEFGKSRHNPNLYEPAQWFLDEVEVTEMEYYGITSQTTLEEIGEEPADMLEYQEWKIKRSIIQHRDRVDFFLF